MDRPFSLLPVSLPLSLTLSLLAGCQTVKKQPLPNIVVILADDLGYGDVGALNPASGISTPNIDRLASAGMTFTDAHSPSAVCSPTRYGLLTGEYCFRTSLKSGVLTGFSKSLIDDETLTMAEMLRESGYHTACIGKWHLGLDWPRVDTTLPLILGDGWGYEKTDNVDYTTYVPGGPKDHGFDYSFIIPASLDIIPYVYLKDGYVTSPVHDTTGGRNHPRGVFWRAGDIMDGFVIEDVLSRLFDEATAYLESRSGSDDPFFLYLPLTAPHTPWLPLEPFIGTSQAGLYGDFVAQVDDGVGTILNLLDALNKSDNTLIIFTSDNGAHWTPSDTMLYAHRANYHFRGMKSDVWEGGHHVPLLVRWPAAIAAGSSSEEVVCLTDFWKTFAAITGYPASATDAPDSYNLLPVLTHAKQTEPVRPYTIHHSVNGIFAIRQGNYKLIDNKGSGGWSYAGTVEDPPQQLYDLKNDPSERTNLIGDLPGLANEMRLILEEVRNQR